MNPIRSLRERAALTQDGLARVANTSQPTIAAYEAGRKSPTLDTLHRLARAAGLRADIGYSAPLTREDRRSLALHRAIARRVDMDPGTAIAMARGNLRRMQARQSGAAKLLREWDAILDRPVAALLALLTDPGDWPRELRHVTPFAGILSAAERAAAYRAFAADERRAR